MLALLGGGHAAVQRLVRTAVTFPGPFPRPLFRSTASSASSLAPALLTLTPSAIARLRALAARPAAAPPAAAAAAAGPPLLRISVTEGGCRGLEYKFSLETLGGGGAAAAASGDEASGGGGGEDVIVNAGDGARVVLDTVRARRAPRSTSGEVRARMTGCLFTASPPPPPATNIRIPPCRSPWSRCRAACWTMSRACRARCSPSLTTRARRPPAAVVRASSARTTHSTAHDCAPRFGWLLPRAPHTAPLPPHKLPQCAPAAC